MSIPLLIFAGGGAGSLVRYLVGLLFRNTLTGLPVATFMANLSACMVFALFIFLDRNRPFTPAMQGLWLTGFCGGLSTFSAFGFETWQLIASGQWMAAALNVFGTTGVSLLLFYFATR